MQFEDMLAQVKTEGAALLFRLNRAILISSCNLVIALVVFFLERGPDA
ncbi:MAG: hypothetical protein HQL09_08140 [Nitrospirae bacterium]|nr:hypothetical protein [Nitrospirota bacterium]